MATRGRSDRRRRRRKNRERWPLTDGKTLPKTKTLSLSLSSTLSLFLQQPDLPALRRALQRDGAGARQEEYGGENGF